MMYGKLMCQGVTKMNFEKMNRKIQKERYKSSSTVLMLELRMIYVGVGTNVLWGEVTNTDSPNSLRTPAVLQYQNINILRYGNISLSLKVSKGSRQILRIAVKIVVKMSSSPSLKVLKIVVKIVFKIVDNIVVKIVDQGLFLPSSLSLLLKVSTGFHQILIHCQRCTFVHYCRHNFKLVQSFLYPTKRESSLRQEPV